MSRRGENIYKRKDGRWEGRYISGYDTVGKAKYKFVYARTYSEVRIKMQKRMGSDRLKSTDTIVSDWILWYLESKKVKLKLSTVKLYERHINNYIKPFFKNISLKKLNKEILQAFVNSMSDMSPSTVKSVFSFVRESLKEAHKKNYILPIWIDVELPKLKKNKVEVFTKEEQHLIENVLNTEEAPNDIGVLICLYTGLRIGEVCGLKWEDIDFVSNYLTVNRTVQRLTIDNKSMLMELEPKSETSHRKIPLPSFLVKNLLEIKTTNASPYILHTGYNIMDPRTFQNRYKRILARAGVRYLNAHTLRHTFSVRALEIGFDIKTLSEILGHADASITLKTYAHSLDEHKRNSMERLGALRV